MQIFVVMRGWGETYENPELLKAFHTREEARQYIRENPETDGDYTRFTEEVELSV